MINLSLLFVLIIALGTTVFMLYNVIAIFRGAPFVPVPQNSLSDINKLLDLKSGDSVVDLGSGLGRIVFALKKDGVKVSGIEINPILVLISKFSAIIKRVEINFINDSFWSYNFGSYTAVVMYCMPYKMRSMMEKIQREMKKGSRVVTYGFTFPDWEPREKSGKAYLYIV